MNGAIVLFIFCLFVASSSQDFVPKQIIPEDAKLNFTALAKKYKLDVSEHDVTTEDGYILKLFNIPGNKSRPVLLMHGFMDSADTFIIRGRKSLAVCLAEAGYDVWVGNVRGVSYSRRHVTLNPDADSRFWDYSFHEVGYYDMPATIDHILKNNDVKKLSVVGHSQGNMIFYVLGSTRPEYNDKINVMIALGPVCYMKHIKPPVRTAIQIGPLINAFLLITKQEEVFSEHSIYKLIFDKLCTQKDIGYKICGELFFAIAGYDVEELEPDMFYIVIGHYPKSTSRKNAVHFMQIANENKFSQFNYGPEGNLKRYKSKMPPKYDLSKVTMNVALFAGKNDKLAQLKDVNKLRRRLPHVVEYKIMEREWFNHMDHIWGRNMNKYLFSHVLRVLNKYNV